MNEHAKCPCQSLSAGKQVYFFPMFMKKMFFDASFCNCDNSTRLYGLTTAEISQL